jgi:hydrogenase accessory protein HypB
LLRQSYSVAALVGDLATENDAMRLARSQAPVKQITTGTLCHLEAAMVQNALEGWDLNHLDFLFIENVGNLVCPSSYDLGENLRLVLISVTEGEDKPLKYPTIFSSADVAVVTKNGLGAGRRVRLGFGVQQYPGGSPRDAGIEALRQDRLWNGRVPELSNGSPWRCAAATR